MFIAKLLFTLAINTVVLIGYFYSAQVAALQKEKQYAATFAQTPPTIDGELNEEVWHLATDSSPFILHHNGAQGQQLTQAKVAYDSSFLYLAFIVSDYDIVANYSKNQSPIFQQDDVVEVFIDPLGKGKPYYELGISPINTFYSLKIIDPKKSSFQSHAWIFEGFESATSVHGTINQSDDIDTGWQVEMKIPFSAFRELVLVNKNLETWRFNLFRIDYSGDLPRQANEYYSWSTLGSFGFHQPKKFGQLQFLPKVDQ